MIDSYRVPMIFFHPGRKLPEVKRDRVVQHVDIGPSILDFLGIATDRTLPFGHSIFDRPKTDWPSVKRPAISGSPTRIIIWNIAKASPSKLFAMARLDTPLTDKPEVQLGWKKNSKPRSNGLPTAWPKIVYITRPALGGDILASSSPSIVPRQRRVRQ